MLPAHLKHLKLRQDEVEQQGRLSRLQRGFADGFERLILRYYRPLLIFSLRHRLTTLALFSGVFILILAFILSGWTRFVFFPRVEMDRVRAALTMPSGTPFEVTDRHIVRMVEIARALQETYRDPVSGDSVIKNIYSTTGADGSAEIGQIRFELQPAEERELEVSAMALINEWRERIGPIPGAESLTFRAEMGRASDPVSIELRSGRWMTCTRWPNGSRRVWRLTPPCSISPTICPTVRRSCSWS